MTQRDELIELVIISGPRRGEILCLPEEVLPDPAGDRRPLNNTPDQALAAIDRLEGELRAALEAFRAPQPESRATHVIERLGSEIVEIRERLARVEEFRAADRAQIQADLAQFKLEVERSLFGPAAPPPSPN
jgi:hypothetical protein